MLRPLSAADLGLSDDSIVRLIGRDSMLGSVMTARIENIEIVKALRGRQSLANMLNSLREFARQN